MTRKARARHIIALIALIALTFARRASASPERVVFEPAPCSPRAFDEGALEQLLQVELTAAGVRHFSVARTGVGGGEPSRALRSGWEASPALPGSPPIYIVLDGTCVDLGVIGARLHGPSLPAEIVRWIPLGDVAWAARPRTIALALAELVQATSPDPAAAPAPRDSLSTTWPSPPGSIPLPVPPPAAPPAVPRSSVPRSLPRWSTAATAEARGFLPDGGVFFGARVGAEYVLSPFAFGAALGAWHGSGSDPLGEVGAWLASGTLSATMGGRAGAVDLQAGPELEVGWVHAIGTAAHGALGYSRDDVVVLVNLRGRLRFAVAGPVSGVLDAGVGATLRGYVAQAGDRSPLAVRNAAFRSGLGLAIAF
jgi:hypothetical protein